MIILKNLVIVKKFANDVEFFDVEMRVGESFIFLLPVFVIKHSVADIGWLTLTQTSIVWHMSHSYLIVYISSQGDQIFPLKIAYIYQIIPACYCSDFSEPH